VLTENSEQDEGHVRELRWKKRNKKRKKSEKEENSEKR